MLKKKALITGLTVITYILFLVITGFFHSDGVATTFLFTFYGVPIMLMIGTPVNILAGFITRNLVPFRFWVNLMIHIIPAYIAGILLFNGYLFQGDGGFLQLFPLGIACIYFIYDELIYHDGRHKKSALLLPLVPVVILGTAYMPILIEIYAQETTVDRIEESGPPVAEVTLQNDSKKISTDYCTEGYTYNSCHEETKPTILPLADIGDTTFIYNGPAQLSFEVTNAESVSFEYVVTYYVNSKQKQLKSKTLASDTVTLPADIPEQIIKVEGYGNKDEKITFFVGLRNGVRYNPENEGIENID
ncbi:hypothetical protein [Alkalihalobacillus sp. CinArs1]|uniref:hypothetical protein n=1 Tax=Alkalihalobacillus sp. CinArs1 TaxID=2995314 RepID=UPI0022DD14A9|nr:hypothetical protein [Alkalihalobacillus sp. CinArs1]